MRFATFAIAFLLTVPAFAAEEDSNYSLLQRKCQNAESPGCCMASVRAMRDGKFSQPKDGKCEPGWTMNMYRCEGSLQWCEPPPAGDVAVNGGSMKFEKRTPPAEKSPSPGGR